MSLAKLARRLRQFPADRRGNVAMLFGLASVMIFVAVGAGLDLARAYQIRQKLAEVAMLSCQFATRPTIIAPVAASNAGGVQNANYISTVTSFIQTSLNGQKLAFAQTNGTPFTYTVNGAGAVTLTATVPTVFMSIMRINSMPVSATSNCFTTVAQVAPSSSPYVLQEGFEGGSVVLNYNLPNGTQWSGGSIAQTTTFNPANVYKSTNNVSWVVMGYCVETDQTGVINSTSPQGSFTAELNCDNGSNSAGNSSISSKQYLNTGEYELRYFYRSRVDYPDYDPAYICGSQISDVSWATNSNSSGGPTANAVKNNQIDVFLDADNGNSAPTHLTNDGTQHLAGSNVIDSCIYSYNWTQRSVRIYVTTAGYYWLSFAADGTNNSFGGQLDKIEFCIATCPGSLQDNFPWTANKNLFEDTFASPVYTADYSNWIAKSGLLYNSKGTSGTANSGWPNLAASGWGIAPYNQADYILQGATQGSQYIELVGWNWDGSHPTLKRMISRQFLLDPGYYQVSYYYLSLMTFTLLSGTQCTQAPASGLIVPANYASVQTGTVTYYGSASGSLDVNTVGVFMSNVQLASTPNLNATIYNAASTTYTNPDGSVTTTPSVAPDGASLTSYSSAQVNPLIDLCYYSSTWATRTAQVAITKPGYYSLTISDLALGTIPAFGGGALDDVKLTALGSVYLSSPPAKAVAIPVPNTQPSATVNYTGFHITANPFSPPAP